MPGLRIPLKALDDAVLDAIARSVCTEPRARLLAKRYCVSVDAVLAAWRRLLRRDDVARNYVQNLIERIVVNHDGRIIITPKVGGRNEADG